MKSQASAAVGGVVLGVLLAGILGVSSGCAYYDYVAPNSPSADAVIKATEEVLGERFYQSRVLAAPPHGGRVIAYSPVDYEGAYPVRSLIEVHIQYERTGHYMPKVFVRKFINLAEPENEGGDFTSPFEVKGHPVAAEDWKPLHFDRALEQEIRQAILAKLTRPS